MKIFCLTTTNLSQAIYFPCQSKPSPKWKRRIQQGTALPVARACRAGTTFPRRCTGRSRSAPRSPPRSAAAGNAGLFLTKEGCKARADPAAPTQTLSRALAPPLPVALPNKAALGRSAPPCREQWWWSWDTVASGIIESPGTSGNTDLDQIPSSWSPAQFLIACYKE